MSESVVVKDCLSYLQLRGAFAWRNQTGMIRLDDSKYGKRVIRQGVKGGADIIGVHAGRFIAVECKTPHKPGPRGGTKGSNQTDDQKWFQAEVEARGGVYIVARGTADLDYLFEKPKHTFKFQESTGA